MLTSTQTVFNAVTALVASHHCLAASGTSTAAAGVVKELWSLPTKGFSSLHLAGSNKDLLVLKTEQTQTANQTLIGIDIIAGKPLWSNVFPYRIGEFVQSIVTAVNGTDNIVVTHCDALVKTCAGSPDSVTRLVDAKTGKELWSPPLAATPAEFSPLVYGNSMVFINASEERYDNFNDVNVSYGPMLFVDLKTKEVTKTIAHDRVAQNPRFPALLPNTGYFLWKESQSNVYHAADMETGVDLWSTTIETNPLGTNNWLSLLWFKPWTSAFFAGYDPHVYLYETNTGKRINRPDGTPFEGNQNFPPLVAPNAAPNFVFFPPENLYQCLWSGPTGKNLTLALEVAANIGEKEVKVTKKSITLPSPATGSYMFGDASFPYLIVADIGDPPSYGGTFRHHFIDMTDIEKGIICTYSPPTHYSSASGSGAGFGNFKEPIIDNEKKTAILFLYELQQSGHECPSAPAWKPINVERGGIIVKVSLEPDANGQCQILAQTKPKYGFGGAALWRIEPYFDIDVYPAADRNLFISYDVNGKHIYALDLSDF